MKKLALISLLGLLACEEMDKTELQDGTLGISTDSTTLLKSAKVQSATISGEYDMVYSHNWENNPPGTYTYSQMMPDFNYGLYEWGLGRRTNIYDPKSCTIVQEGQSKFLRVSLPKGTYGANQGLSWKGAFWVNYSELYLSYDIRFKPGFIFSKGGKLLGLSGGTFTVPYPPTGNNGFDALAVWNPDGTIQSYIYHHANKDKYGEAGLWNPALCKIVPGKWFNITIRVVMNTVGKANGIYEAFVDGKLVFSSQHYEYRKVPTIGIDKLTFISFFGGSSMEYASQRNEYIDYDNINIYRYTGGGHVSGFNLSPSGTVISVPGGITAPSNNGGTDDGPIVSAPGTGSPEPSNGNNSEVALKVCGTAASSVNCHFNLFINGAKIGDKYVTTAEAIYKFKTGIAPDLIKTVEVQFDNDLYIEKPLQDRNLCLMGINVAGQEVNLFGSSVSRPGNAIIKGNSIILLSNGKIKVSR